MRATLNSSGRFLLLVGLMLAGRLSFSADPDFLARAEKAYHAAQEVYATNNGSIDSAITVARTAFDYADMAPNDSIRENIANQGIAAGREAVRMNTNSAPAHYYLALTIGQLARTKMLKALRLLTEMERELLTTIQLDPKFDYAGGHRTIGVLYLEAPGWPTSVGSKAKAKTNLQKAVELAPEFPDNHLSYMEALAKWRDSKALTDAMVNYQAILPKAKEQFTGTQWEDEWFDWGRRFNAIQGKIQKK